MRTSGARGAEGWILAIPLAAMFVAATMSNGGAHAMLLLLESTVRETLGAVVSFFGQLF
jgi:uncharacterized membrane protein YraQ (UPF0718 family)